MRVYVFNTQTDLFSFILHWYDFWLMDTMAMVFPYATKHNLTKLQKKSSWTLENVIGNGA